MTDQPKAIDRFSKLKKFWESDDEWIAKWKGTDVYP
jgi:hypothetical protein